MDLGPFVSRVISLAELPAELGATLAGDTRVLWFGTVTPPDSVPKG